MSSRIDNVVRPLTLAAMALICWSCNSDECSRSSDCPAGQVCLQRRCVEIDTATDGDGEANTDITPDGDADADTHPDADADADAHAEDASTDGDAPTGCTAGACNDFCTSVGQAPGECVAGECFCRGGPDADGGGDFVSDGEPDEGWLCHSDAECDDANPCTTDGCSYVIHDCVHLPLPEGAECSDGLYCNGLETCRSGVCGSGSAPCYSSSPGCQTSTCSESSHSCITENQPDGTACETTAFCEGPGRCQAGSCAHEGPYPCDPVASEPCMAISCNELARRCDTVPKPDGASCEDGVVCNGGERCVGGACPPATPFCDDGNPCTTDVCTEDPIEPTCTHTPISGC